MTLPTIGYETESTPLKISGSVPIKNQYSTSQHDVLIPLLDQALENC
jgi:hypothetical protein